MIQINLLPQKPLHTKWWIGVGVVTSLLLLYSCSRFFSSTSQKNYTQHNDTGTKSTARHSVRRLRMTGFLKKSITPETHLIWGLVKDPDTNITVVKIGDHIGQENLPITAITPKGIQLQSSEKTKCFIPTVSTA